MLRVLPIKRHDVFFGRMSVANIDINVAAL